MEYEKELRRARRSGFWSGIFGFVPLFLALVQLFVLMVLLYTLNFELLRTLNTGFFIAILITGILNLLFNV